MSATPAPRPEGDRVLIFDTTLRDGEQCPGATMTFEEKLEVAELLDEMGVDIIEAGFPIASQGDFDSVQEISRRAKNSVICGLARAQAKDIDVCADAIKPAKQGRIHTFIGTSPLHRKYQMSIDEAEVLSRVTQSVARARGYTDNVEWSAMDATRTEHDFLCRCVEAAIKAGATTVNIPDTVGYATPDEFAELIRMIIGRVPGADSIVFSTHCHDDLGLAVANSLAGVGGGARQVECAINGLGERAGNAALEEIVMAIKTRSDVMPYWTGIDTTMLTRASKLVSRVTAFPVQYIKALADRKKHVYDEDLEALVDQEIASAHDRIKVVALTVIAGTGGPQRATLTLDVDGRQQTHESTGDGPVDATFRAIKAIVPHEARMPLYQVSAVTEGTDAQAEVAVRLEADGKTVTGRGSDTDTLVASARAYVSALNKLLAREGRRKP